MKWSELDWKIRKITKIILVTQALLTQNKIKGLKSPKEEKGQARKDDSLGATKVTLWIQNSLQKPLKVARKSMSKSSSS